MPSPSATGTVDTNSMFGSKPTEFRGTSILSSPRYRELDRRQQYYDCVAHGERIVLEDGGEAAIEEIVPGDMVAGIDATRVERRQVHGLVTTAVRTRHERPLRITMRSGRVLRAYDSHPVYAATETAFDWVKAEKLEPGFHVATPRAIATGNVFKYGANEARLLGYLTGDGSCSRGQFGFTQKASPETAADFERRIVDQGWECVVSPSARWQMRAKGNGVVRFVEESGLAYHRAHQKFVPSPLFAASPEIIAEYLAALWDCDGSVNDAIALALLSTTSRRLAADVQSLLLRLGVGSCVRTHANEHGFGVRPIHIVEVSGGDVRTFATKVALVNVDKAARLAEWAQIPAGTTNTDVVPAAWQSYWLGKKTSESIAPSGNVSREKLGRIADRDSSNEELHALATSDVRWDRIKTIEREPDAVWMYDLTVAGPQSFLASGVFVHNCTQHDEKKYDFDGRIVDQRGAGASATQPLLNSQVAPFYVPLSQRRPHAPARLARVITNAFTNMVFGAQRFPTLRVAGDADTQDFDAELVRATNLSSKMIRARTIGGSVGTVGISWCFDAQGRPRIESHNGKHLFVHEWADREELVAAHVSEVYLTARSEWDGIKKRFLTNWYWHRRDWTPDEDVLFVEAKYEKNQEPVWVPDPRNSVPHADGFCHLAWVQNLPTEGEDGLPDYDGLYELFDAVDILNSVVVKGAILNLDPTLILKMDRDIAGTMGISKGSDNSIVVGIDGGADYLELTGSSLEAGIKLLQEQRHNALETAQCIVPDPADVAAQGVSSVALKAMFGPMMGKCETLRDQYGTAIKRIFDQMNTVARNKVGQKTTVQVPDETTGDMEEREAEFKIQIAQKVTETPKVDDDGQPVLDDEGKPQTEATTEDRRPGQGGDVELDWPEYFPLTPADQTAVVTVLSTAAGGKAILSQQTAVEKAAAAFGVDPSDEWAKVQRDSAVDDQKAQDQAAAFGANGDDAGGKPGADGMPPGAKPKPGKPFGGSKAPFGGGGSKDPDDQGDKDPQD
jgi:intein/homing endonuclease